MTNAGDELEETGGHPRLGSTYKNGNSDSRISSPARGNKH